MVAPDMKTRIVLTANLEDESVELVVLPSLMDQLRDVLLTEGRCEVVLIRPTNRDNKRKPPEPPVITPAGLFYHHHQEEEGGDEAELLEDDEFFGERIIQVNEDGLVFVSPLDHGLDYHNDNDDRVDEEETERNLLATAATAGGIVQGAARGDREQLAATAAALRTENNDVKVATAAAEDNGGFMMNEPLGGVFPSIVADVVRMEAGGGPTERIIGEEAAAAGSTERAAAVVPNTRDTSGEFIPIALVPAGAGGASAAGSPERAAANANETDEFMSVVAKVGEVTEAGASTEPAPPADKEACTGDAVEASERRSNAKGQQPDSTVAKVVEKEAAVKETTTTVKKRPGRPPKNSNKSGQGGKVDEKGKKKKRGRPPKDRSSSGAEQQKPSAAKTKKRGRSSSNSKKKELPEEESSSSPPTKKRRGRPPKNSNKKVNEEDDEDDDDDEGSVRSSPAETSSASAGKAAEEGGSKNKKNNNNNTEGGQKHRIAWETRFSELQEFRNQRGHFDVPNGSLSSWVETQRRAYKAGTLKEERKERLEALGLPWETVDKYDLSWEKNLDEVKAFKQVHGHCKVTGKTNKPLSAWLNQQRRLKRVKALRQDRVDRLNEIGIQWNIQGYEFLEEDEGEEDLSRREALWNKRFQQFRDFKKQHGHYNVPQTGKDGLAKWVTQQRKAYSNGTIRRNHRDLLNAIDFDFNDPSTFNDRKFDARYLELKKFHEVHGHIQVPRAFPGGLSEWIKAQRRAWRKGVLKGERMERLNALGFEWITTKSTIFDERLEQLLEFQLENGHQKVPKSYPGGLGEWVAYQRKAKKKGILIKEREKQLEDVGFQW